MMFCLTLFISSVHPAYANRDITTHGTTIDSNLNVTNPPVMYPEQIAIFDNISKIATAKAIAYMPLLTASCYT